MVEATAVKDAVAVGSTVMKAAPGGTKVVLLAAGGTVCLGFGLYFGGKKLKKAVSGKLANRKSKKDIDDPEVAKLED